MLYNLRQTLVFVFESACKTVVKVVYFIFELFSCLVGRVKTALFHQFFDFFGLFCKHVSVLVLIPLLFCISIAFKISSVSFSEN